MQSTEEKLKQAGLAGNEAKVYLGLLRRGSINGSELAKKVGLDRTLTYQVLNNLVEKGLVNHIIKEHKKYFSATNPENLLSPIKEQEEFVKNLIPELQKVETLKEVEQYVEVYEGKAGLKVLYEEVLASKNLCFFGATGKSYGILQWGMERIEKEFVKKGIKGRGIASNKMRDLKWSKLKNLKLKYIGGDESKDASFGILDKEKVGIICFGQEKPMVIMIRNKFISQTLQNYFEFMWKMASS
jgi:sugar-specific transcriptional regulator TrmB